uniref:Uncharacterized protein n=1 Tax=Arundo donax TaxID=35708 RepID=A0A0A9ENW9_ARUDO
MYESLFASITIRCLGFSSLYLIKSLFASMSVKWEGISSLYLFGSYIVLSSYT